MICKSAPRIVSRVNFGKTAQMVDGRRTVNPVHEKLSGFESLSSHIYLGTYLRIFSAAGSERLPYKQKVGGSNPSRSTNNLSVYNVYW